MATIQPHSSDQQHRDGGSTERRNSTLLEVSLTAVDLPSGVVQASMSERLDSTGLWLASVMTGGDVNSLGYRLGEEMSEAQFPTDNFLSSSQSPREFERFTYQNVAERTTGVLAEQQAHRELSPIWVPSYPSAMSQSFAPSFDTSIITTQPPVAPPVQSSWTNDFYDMLSCEKMVDYTSLWDVRQAFGDGPIHGLRGGPTVFHPYAQMPIPYPLGGLAAQWRHSHVAVVAGFPECGCIPIDPGWPLDSLIYTKSFGDGLPQPYPASLSSTPFFSESGPPAGKPKEIASTEWIIPQRDYKGVSLVDPMARAVVYAPIRDALVPGRLAEVGLIADPHLPAFPDLEGKREHQKFTVRFGVGTMCYAGKEWLEMLTLLQFEHMPRSTTKPKQFNEYLKPAGQHTGKRVGRGSRSLKRASMPLSRAVFSECIASQLQRLCSLDSTRGGWSLAFRGRNIEPEHMTIIEIRRPTIASVQPVLEVHPDFRYLYQG